jgi:co-chaperonin GroES (HSP10)
MSKEQLSTSGNEIPKHKNALEEKYQSKESHVKRLDQDNIQNVVDQLPEPSGWRMLVLPFTPKEKTKGGIIFSQESLDKARIATNCGYVIKMGPLAYGDKEKFPTGPWCKKGDWVIFARYAGSRFTNRRRRSPSFKRR